MWVKAMETLVVFLGEDTSITLADDLSESLAGILEYTNEFSQLSNARMPQPPCMSEVRPPPSTFTPCGSGILAWFSDKAAR